MKYLIDTNVWLELLLEQERAEEVRSLFQLLDPPLTALTELSFYSIGIIMDRLKQHDAFLDFALDSIEDSGVIRLRLDIEDMEQLILNIKHFNLDFDDAYQYTASEKFGLTLVSLDKDFDRTERGRKSPAEILEDRGL